MINYKVTYLYGIEQIDRSTITCKTDEDRNPYTCKNMFRKTPTQK